MNRARDCIFSGFESLRFRILRLPFFRTFRAYGTDLFRRFVELRVWAVDCKALAD